MFGGSGGRGRVLTGTSTQNIANILSHHTIFGIFPQLALFSRPGVFSTGTVHPAIPARPFWCGGQERSQESPRTRTRRHGSKDVSNGTVLGHRNRKHRFPPPPKNILAVVLFPSSNASVAWFGHRQMCFCARSPSKRSRTLGRSVVSAASQP